MYAPVAPTVPFAEMRTYSRRPLGMENVRLPDCPAATLTVFDVALPEASNSVAVTGVSVAVTCTVTVPLLFGKKRKKSRSADEQVFAEMVVPLATSPYAVAVLSFGS